MIAKRGHLVTDSGFVGSEGFPSHYKPNRKCTWYIAVPEGHVVMLSFRMFDLEADPTCRYDYLDVYNGHSHTVQKLGRFCGTFRPGALISTSNTMMLEMVSDSSTGGRGFVAHYQGGKPHMDENQFCGGRLTKAQGSVKTPNWPNSDYPAGISCSWHISVKPSNVITVKFEKLDIEADSYCRYDYVAFFNGGERDDSRRIGKYCGDRVPRTIVTNGNELLVQFVSDLSVTSNGFMAHYSSVPRGSRTPSAGGDTIQRPRVLAKPARTTPKPKSAIRAKPSLKPVTRPSVRIPVKPTPRKPTSKPGVRPTLKPKPAKPIPKAGARPTPKHGTKAKPTPKPSIKVKSKPTPKPRAKTVKPTKKLFSKPGAKSTPKSGTKPKACKRTGTLQSNFCATDFVITGKVTSLVPGPRGSVTVDVSLIKAYRSGRLAITQSGPAMSVKLASTCKKCPGLRKGANYVLMGKVDTEGHGLLNPSSFALLYKAVHTKALATLALQPC
uniref:Procollagen C-endopeptidase enhancer b n=1 Tax=Hucho hucho TaxID=62062 RepID=A0A4W5LY89_9TELE